MKKFHNWSLLIVLALVLTMCVAMFAACTPAEPDLTGLNAAKDYLTAQLRDAATETSADYTRPAALRNEHGSYTVTWTVSVSEGAAADVTVGEAVNGVVTINVNENAAADCVYTLTATIADANGNTVTLTFNHKVPKFAAITIADFLSKEVDEETIYTIQGYVMASAANADKAGSFVVADATGAVFSYTKKIVNVGDKVIVWGKRDVNAGVPQIDTTDIKVVEANSSSYAEETATELKASDLDLAALNDAAMPAMTGKYYKITGSTLVLSDTGYTKSNYNDKQLLSLYTNEAIEGAVADFYGHKVDVYGYVRGYSSGKYLTVQVTKIVWAEDYEYVPTTDESRVAYEKENLTLKNITTEGETELATAGSRYNTVTISWALASNAVATLADNVVTVAALPEADTEITLTATIKSGNVTDTKEFTIKVCAPSPTFIKAALKAGAALEHNQSTKDSYIIIGTVAEITEAYSEQHKNVTFTVTDGVNSIIVFRYNLEDAQTIAVGDKVAFAAPIKKYNDDIEAVSKFVALDVMSLADANAAGVAGTGVADTLMYGQIKSIDTPYSAQHKNITLTITDGTNDLYCYRLAGGEELVVGQYILVTGKPDAYKGSPQVAQGATYNATGIYVAPAAPEEPEEGGNETPSTPAASNVVTFNFASTSTKKGTELNATTALDLFKASANVESGITAVAVTKIYDGNGSGGAYPNTAGLIKTGTSSVAGQLVLTFGSNVSKVEIKCHDWYTKSVDHPTNSNSVAVNGSATQLAPYVEDGTPATLTFELAEDSNVVTIDVAKRVFIFEIVVYFATAE